MTTGIQQTQSLIAYLACATLPTDYDTLVGPRHPQLAVGPLCHPVHMGRELPADVVMVPESANNISASHIVLAH